MRYISKFIVVFVVVVLLNIGLVSALGLEQSAWRHLFYIVGGAAVVIITDRWHNATKEN